jgi:parallel beta helix pectate lyase-like protein/List-Bact-rpt repeat protein
MKKILSICVLSVMLLSIPVGADVLVCEYIAGEKVVYDGATGNYWYWNMPYFTEMSYSAQITAIGQIRSGYGGIPAPNGWHMASGAEINTLFVVGTAPDVGPKFAPTRTYPAMVQGRIEESFTYLGTPCHYVARVYDQMGLWYYNSWSQGGIADATANDPETGAWVTVNPILEHLILRVKKGATGTDGQGWGNTEAFGSLQQALIVAAPGSEIWVAEGTYTPGASGSSRAIAFHMKKGVAIYGGFFGDETARDQRNWQDNVTTLSGDLNGDDVPGGNRSDNCYHVINNPEALTPALDATAILDGFTITRGNADGLAPQRQRLGGGMINYGHSPTVTNCIFQDNQAESSGGGLYNCNSSAIITNCKFKDNTAFSGGGLYNILSNTTITDCEFTDNNGGALYNNQSSPVVTYCTFTGNQAEGSGAIANFWSSDAVIANCIFIANKATLYYGGAMRNHESSPTVTNCIFIANHSVLQGGGAIANIYDDTHSNGIPIITNCTFVANQAVGHPDNVGGGIYNSYCNPIISNCILWDNADNSGSIQSAQICDDNSNPVVTYCCIQDDNPDDSSIPYEGSNNHNIDDNPAFIHNPSPGADGNWDGVDDDYGDLHLTGVSPCIDAGDATAVPADTADLDDDNDTTERTPLDLDGWNRFFDYTPTGSGTGLEDPPDYTYVDLGAYECLYGLIVSSSAGGSVTTPGEGNFEYNYGDPVSIVAQPDAHYYFVEWTGTAVDNGKVADPSAASTTVTIHGDYTLKANFTIDHHTLSISSTAGGSVQTPGEGIHSYNYGQVVTIIAQRSAGYRFVEWTGTAVDADKVDDPTAASTTVTMEADYSLVAHFASTGIVIYVDATKTDGAKNGSSWTDAFTDLQDALTFAIEGEEIWVAAGTYVPTSTHGLTDSDPLVQARLPHFRMKNGVAIYGGFRGTETARAQRDWQANVTILSGDLNKDDEFGGDNSDNAYHVLFHPGGLSLNATAILDGFTITAGNADGPYSGGGGMYNDCADPTVTNCTFACNSATNGGGMYNKDGSDPSITNCTFSSNGADEIGGGIYNINSEPLLASCTFSGNSAYYYGGGMFNSGDCEPFVTNCTFSGNSTVEWGGGMYNLGSSPTVINCTFSGNSADSGGGMFAMGDPGKPPITPTIISRPTVSNCIFYGNIDNSGSIQSAQIFEHTESYFTVTYSCIQDDDGPGGSIPYGGSSNNNIDANPTFVRNPDPGANGWDGLDDDYGDLHLLPVSPCIDVGSNSALPPDTADLDGDGDTGETLPWDLDGDPRILTGDQGPTVDMGADEVLYAGNPTLQAGGIETYNPGGGTDDPLAEALIRVENIGSSDGRISIAEIPTDPHPGQTAFKVYGTTLIVDTSLNDGDFLMTLTIPIDLADVSGGSPNFNIYVYDEVKRKWILAVEKNTTGSSQIHFDIHPLDPAPTLSELHNYGLGHYGFYGNPAQGKGFAWANVNHASDYTAAILTGDQDGDGVINLIDLDIFARAWLAEVNDPNWNPLCDLVPNGKIDLSDFAVLAAFWLTGT